MGNYHGSYPENVQSNRQRKICFYCGMKRFSKFMSYGLIGYKYKGWVCKYGCK